MNADSPTDLPRSFDAPFRLSPIAVERVWGGRHLVDRVHPDLDLSHLEDGRPIGETWEVSDVGDDPLYHSRVVEGWATGRTLRELLGSDLEAMVGSSSVGVSGSESLPLLYKLIDARQPLSVQVHPSDETVAARGIDGAGKTEAWLILEAEPDAQIIYGFEEGVTYADYLAWAKGGDGRRGLAYHPVSAGDLIYLPAGTLHAIGAGIVLAEIQQSSDTTYRIYDWDRLGLDGAPRQLHLEEASWIEPPDPLPPCPYPPHDGDSVGGFRCRVQVEPFELWEAKDRAPDCRELPDRGGRFAILSVLAGEARWRTNESDDPHVFGAGSCAFVPATCPEGSLETTDDAHVLWMLPGR